MEEEMIQITDAAREEIARTVEKLDNPDGAKAVRVYIAGHG